MELKPYGTLPLPDAKRLAASKFIWEKYCSKQAVATHTVLDDAYTHLLPGWELVGWCPSSELKIRMRTEGAAIMVWHEEEGIETWLHILSDKFPMNIMQQIP